MNDKAPDTAKTNAAASPPADLEKLAKVNQFVIRTLGEAVSLMASADKYQGMTIAEIKTRVVPAILLRQCRIFRHKGFPIAFVSWALLSDEAQERLRQDGSQMEPRDWRSGSRLHFVDVVSPKGREEEIKEAVRRDLSGYGEREKGSTQAQA